MRRRSLLATLPTAFMLAGCSALTTAELQFSHGIGILKPATDRQLFTCLQPHGDARVFATVGGDESPELVTDETEWKIDGIIRQDGGALKHLITQLRSTPDGPMELAPTAGSNIRVDGDTLVAPVTVEPKGSFDCIEDAQERARLRTAEELVYTGAWSFEPKNLGPFRRMCHCDCPIAAANRVRGFLISAPCSAGYA